MDYPNPPLPFLELKVHELDLSLPVSALYAGYEGGCWRSKQLAEHTMEWLPEFCLDISELNNITSSNAVRMLRKAANLVYQTDKYKNRGEFGEIFLHIALRQICSSTPVVSKFFFKDSANSTVKGFDAVHIVKNGEEIELWLGEVKFYDDEKRAIRDVIEEIEKHVEIGYIRNEKIFLLNKINKDFVYYDILERLLDQNTSIDDLFDCMCIPILITYDSDVLKKYNKSTELFIKDAKDEILSIQQRIAEKITHLKLPVKVHLFLLPLQDKQLLVNELDKQLKGLQ